MSSKIKGFIFLKGIITLLIATQADTTVAYEHMVPKDNFFTNMLMSEILNHMDNNIVQGESYIDPASEISTNLALIPRTSKNKNNGDIYYEGLYTDSSNPSIRDQEYLQHSSLWGHQYVSGGMGEGPNQFKAVVKTDASLPAYCNPPNPCPHGYTEDQGCINDFDNTAIFSREYQASQECMCDSEHMFDCAGQDKNRNKNDMATDIENFLVQQFQPQNEITNNKYVSKKMISYPAKNPYLKGEQLPIAAKKGNNVN